MQRKRNEHNGIAEGLNHAMRRLWTTFRKSGGDFRDAAEVDELTGVVQNCTLTLPPRQRWAFELVSAALGVHPYPGIIAELRRQGTQLKEPTLRRLVERAISKIEDDIRARRWSRGGTSANGGSTPSPSTRSAMK